MVERAVAGDGALALPTGPHWVHRLVRLNEWVRERFWSIPAVLVAAGVLTAVVVCRPDLVGLGADWDLGHVVRIRTADTMLQVMASSMLTFVGVVFAITLVGLQLASSQLSPRVIRTFIRSGVTKTAFGIFLATFAFAVTALAFDNVDDAAAASRTVGACVAMLAVAVVVFIIYVTSTMRLLEVGWVITTVANEARVAIRRSFPPESSYVTAAPPDLDDTPQVIHLPSRDTRGFTGVLGTVLGIDRPRLVRLASTHRCVIELVPRIGEYVASGGPVFAVHGGNPPDDSALLGCLDLGRARTLYQDPTFGIRQLVDVATQALSPAINQPSTAVQVIDRLYDLLLRIGRVPTPTGLHLDTDHVVRLVEQTLTPAYLLDLAFQEISQVGASSWHVTRRLAAAYADLSRESPDDWHPAISRLRESLEELSRAQTHAAWADGIAVQPDRLGLG
ncbi:DUF2254 domain-containing protein [Marmoricola sp. URHB0036]|uniref:DUF2254 domain-containing protein n=1 Tax=Marmoricola sp. URHB0036 TaxID=1298863 RepID=UPI0018CB4D69|nr:DUF2254 domain-containing protein [Marmoricola sp. URHB0036]